jgi:hypothetical protein
VAEHLWGETLLELNRASIVRVRLEERKGPVRRRGWRPKDGIEAGSKSVLEM